MTQQVVSFAAKSGSGKTTLQGKVIAHLRERGDRVGMEKRPGFPLVAA